MVGSVSFLITLYDFFSFILGALLLVVVDITRETNPKIPKVIFALGILGHVFQAIGNFSGKYRRLKVCVFTTAQELDGFNRVLKEDGKTPLLRKSGPHRFEQSLPRSVFEKVCEEVSPHQVNAVGALLQLTASLLSVCLFFIIIWYYQLFSNVTETTETFLSLVTVSIPQLFGILKSAGFKKVCQLRTEFVVQAQLNELTVLRDDSN
jgi:hypothetical protein